MLQYVDSINVLYDAINSVSADIAVQANTQFAAAVNVATPKCRSLQQIFTSFLFLFAIICAGKKCSVQLFFSDVVLLPMCLCFFLAYFK